MRRVERPVLEVKNLAKYFGGIVALRDFDLTVNKGDLHCLIGPNGAGKTTVLKIVMGIYPASSGVVSLNGKNISKLKSNQIVKEGVSIKMQVPGVYHEMTLRENMIIAAQNFVPKNELNDKIDELIERVKIKDLGDPLVKNMSHGQQQWLEIAMALASDPKLLLLDEPAAGLGPEETDFTAKLVTELNESGMTVLFIEHDMNFVKAIAREVTVLHQGRKFAEGTLDDILANEEVQRIYLGKEKKKG